MTQPNENGNIKVIFCENTSCNNLIPEDETLCTSCAKLMYENLFEDYPRYSREYQKQLDRWVNIFG